MKYIGSNKDNKLADKGWVDMRRALDREMPRERRRRRFLWWWFAPVLLAGIGLAIWQGMGHDLRPAQVQPPALFVPIGPVAAKPQEPASPAAGLSENGPSRVTKADAAPAASLASTESAAARRSLVAVTKPEARTVAGALPESKVLLPDPTATANAEAADKSPAKAIQFIDNQPKKITLSSPVGALPLPFGMAASQEVRVFPRPSNVGVQPAPSRKEKDVWDFGASASVGTRDFSGFHDAGIGMVADFKRSRHWGLRSGIAYGYEQLPFTSATLVSAPAVYDTSAPDIIIVDDLVTDPSYSGPNYVPAQVQTQVSAVHRLDLPLMIWWQPARRWRVYAGGSLSHTLKVQTGSTTVAVGNFQVNNGAISDPDNRIEQLANQKIARWRGAVQSGISYRPTKHLEIGFMAQNRFTDPSNKNAELAFSGSGSGASLLTQQASRWRFHLSATLLF